MSHNPASKTTVMRPRKHFRTLPLRCRRTVVPSGSHLLPSLPYIQIFVLVMQSLLACALICYCALGLVNLASVVVLGYINTTLTSITDNPTDSGSTTSRGIAHSLSLVTSLRPFGPILAVAITPTRKTNHLCDWRGMAWGLVMIN